MRVRGVRGAISVEANEPVAINQATKQLLRLMLEENSIQLEDICSVFFTATEDLNASYPAVAARELGFVAVPLLCFNEMKVLSSMEKIIRVLLHVNTSKTQQEIKHIYLGRAKNLRPDLAGEKTL